MNRSLHILLVEDDPNVGATTVDTLVLRGYRVTLVATASTALSALSTEHDFDAILLDLRLGEERGETVFEKLRLLSIKYPPVIILSAQPAIELRLAAQKISAATTLQKPVRIAEIEHAIELAVAA
jgi:DNA-binding response OmpR family regulator